MKKPSLMILSTLLLAGCGDGKFQKNPVSDLSTIRQEGKVVTEMGPQKPTTLTNTVVVEKPQVVTKEESTIDEKFIVITPDAQMSFNEGQTASYNIRVRVLIPGVQVKLMATGLPESNIAANRPLLVPSTTEKDLYTLTWTPALYTVPANASMKSYTVKLVAQVSATDNTADVAKLKGLLREEDVSLFLFRNQELPSDLKVSGLSSEIGEGQVVPFTVTAKIPGLDANAPQKPRLVISYDGVGYTVGNSFLELDGSRYIVADTSKKDAEYLGDSQWKFSLLFDTKNISVQPQLAKDGSVLSSADGTRVRLTFKVYSPSGLSTPDSLSQLKIKYNRKISSPRFDLSGLAKTNLEVSRGENISLKFIVSSADSNAQVAVTAKDASLPGSPKVNCAAEGQNKNKQQCTLTWLVPCDATADMLSGQIEMAAISTVGGQSSESTTYTLKTVAAAQDKNLCNASAQQGK